MSGPTIRPVEAPPAYFRVAATGRIHLVKTLVRVSWPGSSVHESIQYWCGNIAPAERGQLHSNRPYEGVACRRCIARRPGGRRRKPWKT